MLNLLLDKFLFGNEKFGLVWQSTHPYLSIFGLEIYLYALVIVAGMCVAIVVAAYLFKKRGYDPYDATIYALVVIPVGVIGARMYVYIFPWSGQSADWSTFFNFRSGGLGIYGGVILGYIGAFICCKIKKQDFRLVTDGLMPGVMVAQSMGRWGNFFNQEAYGNLITNDYSAMPNWFEGINNGPLHGFNGKAVWVVGGNQGSGWYQATFFYESVCTLVGFLICILLLTRLKAYRRGWCTAFYGIYYGIVRLVIEGMRTDSLYLYLGTRQTDIKISQLVSVFTICLGLLLISQIYRKSLHAMYRKLFKSELAELSASRWVLLAVSVCALALGVTMFALGGESKFIVGFFATLLAIYSALGIWALNDRMKLYCKSCGERALPNGGWQTDHDKYFAQTVLLGALSLGLLVLAMVALCKMGIIDGVPNGYVLAITSGILTVAVAYFGLIPAYKRLATTPKTQFDGQKTCPCGTHDQVKLNSFLLCIFPPKVYRDYTVDGLKPWVDPAKVAATEDGKNTENATENAAETTTETTHETNAESADTNGDGAAK